MKANAILLYMKYARMISLFSEIAGITLDQALAFFYGSLEYQLIRDGVSDLHCMSDKYLAEDLEDEYLSTITVKTGKELLFMPSQDNDRIDQAIYESEQEVEDGAESEYADTVFMKLEKKYFG